MRHFIVSFAKKGYITLIHFILLVKRKMITSKEILNLLEFYQDVKNMPNGVMTVFTNPSRGEITNLRVTSKNKNNFFIRFIANGKSGQIHVFDGTIGVHNDVLKLLGLPVRFTESPYLILGAADVVSSGDMDLLEVHLQQPEIIRLFPSPTKLIKFYTELFGYKWDWVDRYIRNFKMSLDTEHKKFEHQKSVWYKSKGL